MIEISLCKRDSDGRKTDKRMVVSSTNAQWLAERCVREISKGASGTKARERIGEFFEDNAPQE